MRAILNVRISQTWLQRTQHENQGEPRLFFFNEVGVTANKGKAELTGWKAIRPNQREEKERKPQTSADNF